jgi:hypothetical protein
LTVFHLEASVGLNLEPVEDNTFVYVKTPEMCGLELCPNSKVSSKKPLFVNAPVPCNASVIPKALLTENSAVIVIGTLGLRVASGVLVGLMELAEIN